MACRRAPPRAELPDAGRRVAAQPIEATCHTPGGATIDCGDAAGAAAAGCNILTVSVSEEFAFITPLVTDFFGGACRVTADTSSAVLVSAVGGGGTGGRAPAADRRTPPSPCSRQGWTSSSTRRAPCRTPACARSPATTGTSAMARPTSGSSIPTNHVHARPRHLRHHPRGHQPGRRADRGPLHHRPVRGPDAESDRQPADTGPRRPPRPARRRHRPSRRVPLRSPTSPGEAAARAGT